MMEDEKSAAPAPDTTDRIPPREWWELVHPSHRMREVPGAEGMECARCLGVSARRLNAPCVGGAAHATHPRPWRAEPMDPSVPFAFWRVVGPSKSGRGEVVIISHLSELDARAIAEGGNAMTELAI